MPTKTKDLSRVSAKWNANTSGSTSSYAEGVANPKQDWKQATAAASETWKQGVAKAASDNRFQKGVNNSSSEKQMQAAMTKGVNRFSEGVAVAQPAYQEAMAPVLNTIASVTPPPRGPKGDPNNIKRVSAYATALNAAKKAR